MEISSVDNMMKFLDKSAANGWHIVGTALTPEATSIYEIPVGKPTIIVLGTHSLTYLLTYLRTYLLT
jgi:21S rRNA (GM2251-2'-O)-methyltransferase